MGTGAVVGALRAELSASIAKFRDDMGAAADAVKKFSDNAERQGRRIESVGKRMSLAITAPLVAFGIKAVKAGKESAQALGQVAAALTATGSRSGKTAVELQKSAKALESISTFDDDDILKKTTANLLSFANVSGKTFERAQLAIVNMSAKLGQDLQTATLAVGRALNDPISGMARLSRAGIQFTTEQQNLVKHLLATNRGAEAQSVILTELERRFSGAAAAQRAGDPFAAMAQSFRELSETAGPLIVDVIKPLIELVGGLAAGFGALSPAMQRIVVYTLAFAAALGPIITLVGGTMTVIGGLTPILAGLAGGILGITLATWGWIAAIAAVVAAMVVFRQAIGSLLTGDFAKAWADAKKTATDMWTDLTTMFTKKPIQAPINVAPTAGGAATGEFQNFATGGGGSSGNAAAAKAEGLSRAVLQFTRAVEENDRAVRRFAAGGLDPLSDRLETVDTAYEGLRDKIQAQIDDVRELAGSNAAAAAGMARMEEQLLALAAAHAKATEGARLQFEADSRLRDAEAAVGRNRAIEGIVDLRMARGEGGPIGEEQQRMLEIARSLSEQQLEAERNLAALRGELIVAQQIGDEAEAERLIGHIALQEELAALIDRTSVDQIRSAERVQQAYSRFTDSLEDSLADMLSNWTLDLNGLVNIFRDVAKDLLFKPIASGIVSGIGGLAAGFVGGLAGGGNVGPGQWAVTGESGPELVFGGRHGASVIPAGGESMRGGDTYIDARGADTAAVSRLGGVVAELQRRERGRVLSYSADANSRTRR